MKSTLLMILALVPLAAALPAEELTSEQVTSLLKEMQSRDIETRQGAMVELQTSLDPRIPDACLPVLEMEGESIRRLAARAIGSRWHQIPAERVEVFTTALTKCLGSEHDGLVNMARRGIALLKRKYDDPMLSRSKSRRWVIYERHGSPCLIDTKTMTEELLGHDAAEDYVKFSAAWGNSEVEAAAVWHPKKDMVALDIILGRKASEVWAWRHGGGLRKLKLKEVIEKLGHNEETISGPAGLYTEIQGWKGDALEFTLSYATTKGDDLIDHVATLRWDASKDVLSVISNQ